MSKPIEQFADAARSFCRWAEDEPKDSTSEARTARRLLAELYLRAIDLPEVSADTDAPTIDQKQYESIFKRFGAFPFNYYSECFNPLVVPPEEPVTSDLADDLADIWRDLKGGLLLYDSGAIEAAVWEWRFNFSAHWAHHACGALYPGFPIWSWYSPSQNSRCALISAGSDKRNSARKGDTLWVRKKPSRFSSPSTGF